MCQGLLKSTIIPLGNTENNMTGYNITIKVGDKKPVTALNVSTKNVGITLEHYVKLNKDMEVMDVKFVPVLLPTSSDIVGKYGQWSCE